MITFKRIVNLLVAVTLVTTSSLCAGKRSLRDAPNSPPKRMSLAPAQGSLEAAQDIIQKFVDNFEEAQELGLYEYTKGLLENYTFNPETIEALSNTLHSPEVTSHGYNTSLLALAIQLLQILSVFDANQGNQAEPDMEAIINYLTQYNLDNPTLDCLQDLARDLNFHVLDAACFHMLSPDFYRAHAVPMEEAHLAFLTWQDEQRQH
jgi:hypothetical protein